MNVYFIGGGGGTDAPGIVWDGKKFKRVPGWNPEAMAELAGAIRILGAAARLKTPGLAEAAAKAVGEFAQKELGKQLKDGGVLVIG